MIPAVLIAAALVTSPVVPAAATAFGQPLSDADLSSVVSSTRPLATWVTYRESTPAVALGEQIDNWMASEGLALIAEAIRPTQGLPEGLGLSLSASGDVRLTVTLLVSTDDQ